MAYNDLGFQAFLQGDVRRNGELREESRRLAERYGDERQLRFLRGVAITKHFYCTAQWHEALQPG